MTTPERELLQRARAYDAQALAEIYDRYSGPMYRYLVRFLGDPALAEDLASEVFLKLLQAMGTARAPRERLQAWLYGVAHNLAVDWSRRQALRSSVALTEEISTGGHEPAAELEERQSRQKLRAAIRRLTPDQQRVVLLRFGEGLKLAEVAQAMGKSEGAVKILQHRAIERLRRLMEQ